ncbi:MAG: hypothetical protein FD180_736 [Planctomycetota bacterium]|nr:MAG: hypothetical protein FD180_736 [Planctomycetota bacterium]
MQAYPVAPPPPRRSRFPFVIVGCLVAFTTLCALVVIAAGAAAFAFVTVASAPPPQVSGAQTADLFFIHMSAGRWGDASRLVAPELAGSVAAIGEDNRAVWGESRGCSSSRTNADVDWDGCGLRHYVKSTLQYNVKGTDGVSRQVSMRVQNGLITDLSVEGKPLLGGLIYLQNGCTIVPSVRAVQAPAVVTPPVEDKNPPESEAPKAPKKKTK